MKIFLRGYSWKLSAVKCNPGARARETILVQSRFAARAHADRRADFCVRRICIERRLLLSGAGIFSFSYIRVRSRSIPFPAADSFLNCFRARVRVFDTSKYFFACERWADVPCPPFCSLHISSSLSLVGLLYDSAVTPYADGSSTVPRVAFRG